MKLQYIAVIFIIIIVPISLVLSEYLNVQIRTINNQTFYAKQLNDAFNSVKDNEAVFKSRITKISVEMIGENEESIIIIEKQLC